MIIEAIDPCTSINFDKSKYKTILKDVKDYFLNLNEVDIIDNNFKLYSNALGISLNEKNNQFLNDVISYDERFLYCALPLKMDCSPIKRQRKKGPVVEYRRITRPCS